MIPAIASRIPLVRRPKAPALPLHERLTHLTELTVAPAGASHHDLVARASGVLNYAALIASDVGMPHLATDLCWRQHQVFAHAGRLTETIAVMSLMPLVNISRLLTRDGDGDAAYEVLQRLYRAAKGRGAVEIRGHTVDLAPLTGTDRDHRKICEELWITLLIDGARALARTGRWTEAAEAMAAHRGVGHRLLDGRQITIMSLMERGLTQQAHAMIESATPAEPWENTVAALLRAHCRAADSPTPRAELDRVLREVLALNTAHDPATAVFAARAGLAALELDHDHTAGIVLRDTVADSARHDAYAAREVLQHSEAAHLTDEQKQKLGTSITVAGLGAGSLPQTYLHILTQATDTAEAALGELL
ncbi:hypothetical protein [Streptomyces sp. RFCAC02]|uniref:hypothetical protein n=1 Tax=Streptomyces sp. RFCAC02 TaxID=2499143 RepID=UPI00101F0191|nr:hypothetical protein [Streptomyces sp. RFCAC02]